ncbi:DUF4145 domain-containing protein, partial [Candidatus Peregrinibacteria bacterium]|nr:DUF4145 domain-containing protein [Candidatus Peregrinibacteria bacterium]
LLKYAQQNKTGDLKKETGEFFGLKQMINHLFQDSMLTFPPNLKSKVNSIKWLGDKGAHNFDLEIFREDIKENMLNIREFITTLSLKN